MKDRFKVVCATAEINLEENKHVLTIHLTSGNMGLFGSKTMYHQFEKIESVLSKRYFKLPFGIRILI